MQSPALADNAVAYLLDALAPIPPGAETGRYRECVLGNGRRGIDCVASGGARYKNECTPQFKVTRDHIYLDGPSVIFDRIHR